MKLKKLSLCLLCITLLFGTLSQTVWAMGVTRASVDDPSPKMDSVIDGQNQTSDISEPASIRGNYQDTTDWRPQRRRRPYYGANALARLLPHRPILSRIQP